MKNLFNIFLLFLLVTFTFSLDKWDSWRDNLKNLKCPEGTQRGCAALGRKTICRCVQKCKEDEYIQCHSLSPQRIRCSCNKRFD